MDTNLTRYLKDFISLDTKVEIDHYTTEKAAFLIVDMDMDGEAELLILFKQQGEEYLGMIKRKGSFWRLKEVSLNEEDETMLGDMLEPIVNDGITLDQVGQAYRLKDLYEEEDQYFICLEGKRSYHCKTQRSFAQESVDLEVIDFKTGDILGNGVEDQVYLLGTRVFGETNPEVKNLTLRVVAYNTKEEIELTLPIETGYGPSLIVEDFTGDLKKDIMVMSYTSPGSYVYTDIYSIIEDEIKQIFSSNTFNETYTGEVAYQDDYRVAVSTDQPGKIYGLDLSQKQPQDLDLLYDENKKLKAPTQGTLLGAVAVNVVDYNRDGIYDLDVIQRILGADHIENLGLVETFLKWSIPLETFIPYMQYVSIYGAIKQ